MQHTKALEATDQTSLNPAKIGVPEFGSKSSMRARWTADELAQDVPDLSNDVQKNIRGWGEIGCPRNSIPSRLAGNGMGWEKVKKMEFDCGPKLVDTFCARLTLVFFFMLLLFI
ncbi:hypothetical protein E2320_021908 [Naja naja]|nr:hypothetical protein E2320_021908 [Naja naja]